jgi:hypothetical protein
VVFPDTAAREKIACVLSNSIAPFVPAQPAISLEGSQGFRLAAGRTGTSKPVRLVVFSDDTLESHEVAQLFSSSAPAGLLADGRRLDATKLGSNSFELSLSSAPYYPAADYLEWTSQFEADFDQIREALKRPYARMAGDYSKPFDIPIQNFVALRVLSQTLAERAQAFLLLGKPADAVRELSLLHNLSRLLQAPPGGRPMTLVAAMMNVAIVGLYVNTIADGFRLHAWEGPQLTALQDQLQEVNLLGPVRSAIQGEAAGVCRILETGGTAQMQRLWFGGSSMNLWQRLQDPRYWFVSCAPRGWVYQNMVTMVSTEQNFLTSLDNSHQLVFPERLESATREFEKNCGRFSPRYYLAAIAIPNYVKACWTMARNQTLVNEALLACALERYRLANGQYAANLDALLPGFATNLPHDVIGGQPLHYVLKEKDRYLLYSVGWDGKDDLGRPASKEFIFRAPNGAMQTGTGDWVWLQEK